jgi:hypothetical protein
MRMPPLDERDDSLIFGRLFERDLSAREQTDRYVRLIDRREAARDRIAKAC